MCSSDLPHNGAKSSFPEGSAGLGEISYSRAHGSCVTSRLPALVTLPQTLSGSPRSVHGASRDVGRGVLGLGGALLLQALGARAGTTQRLQENPPGLYHRLTYCCFLSDSNLVISSLSLLISFSS